MAAVNGSALLFLCVTFVVSTVLLVDWSTEVLGMVGGHVGNGVDSIIRLIDWPTGVPQPWHIGESVGIVLRHSVHDDRSLICCVVRKMMSLLFSLLVSESAFSSGGSSLAGGSSRKVDVCRYRFMKASSFRSSSVRTAFSNSARVGPHRLF